MSIVSEKLSVHLQCYPPDLHKYYGDIEAPGVSTYINLYPSNDSDDKLQVSISEIRRVMKKSIHKGKFLGLSQSTNVGLTEINQLPKSASDLEYTIMIEHMNDSLQQLIAHLFEQKTIMTKKGQDLIHEKMVIDLALSSDQIEGSTIRWKDTKRLNINKSPKSLSQDDREFVYHCQTIKELLLPIASKRVHDINTQFMHTLHVSLQITDEEHQGRFRAEVVSVPGRSDDYFSPVEEIETRCEVMFQTLYERESSRQFNPIEQASWLHQQFIQIHPYLDGNGRTGRLLMNAVLLQAGFPLTSIQPGIRFIYYNALHAAHILDTADNDHNSNPPLALLTRIIAESVLRSFQLDEHILDDDNQ